MGRLLDIARTLPNVAPPPRTRASEGVEQTTRIDQIADPTTGAPKPLPSARSAQSAIRQTIEYNPTAADVLDVLARADAPLLHTAILKRLGERGHSKKEGSQAIKFCQRRGWIEHNLVSGYVLTGGRPSNPS